MIQGTNTQLTFNSYGTYGPDGITVALLGRAKPIGVVLAGLLFGALHVGGTYVEAATLGQVPADIVQVLEGLIVLFVAAPALIRAVFRLREHRGYRHGGGREGVERVTTIATAVRAPLTRRTAGTWRRVTFIVLGLINIAVFGAARPCGRRQLRAVAGVSEHQDPGDQGAGRAGLLRARRRLRSGWACCARRCRSAGWPSGWPSPACWCASCCPCCAGPTPARSRST